MPRLNTGLNALVILTLSVAAPSIQAQDTLLVGTVTNLGTDGQGRPLSASFVLTQSSSGERFVGALAIGPGLGGSGDADGQVWRDTLLLRSISPTGDSIAWLAWRVAEGQLAGPYRIYGGPYVGQGGTWRGTLAPTGRSLFAARTKTSRPATLARADFRRVFGVFVAPAETLALNPARANESLGDAVLGSDRYRETVNRILKEHPLGRDPHFLAHVQRFQEQGASTAEVRDEGARLARQGVYRLAPAGMAMRIQLFAMILDRAAEAECAQIWVSPASATSAAMLVSALDSAGLHTWVTLAFDATLAQLTGGRRILTDSVAASAAITAVIASQDPADARRLADIWLRDTPSKPEACWAARTTYGRIRLLPAEQRDRYALDLTTIEGFAQDLLTSSR